MLKLKAPLNSVLVARSRGAWREHRARSFWFYSHPAGPADSAAWAPGSGLAILSTETACMISNAWRRPRERLKRFDALISAVWVP
jgi:hypothetical protein